MGMSPLIAGTHYILPDEPCYGLYELNFQSPGNKGFHRYQIILVIRGDRLAEYRQDMGLAKKYKGDQVRIPGGVKDETTGRITIVHTVAELQELAEYIRAMPLHGDVVKIHTIPTQEQED